MFLEIWALRVCAVFDKFWGMRPTIVYPGHRETAAGEYLGLQNILWRPLFWHLIDRIVPECRAAPTFLENFDTSPTCVYLLLAQLPIPVVTSI
jgi:hypothetical protein